MDGERMAPFIYNCGFRNYLRNTQLGEAFNCKIDCEMIGSVVLELKIFSIIDLRLKLSIVE